MAAEKKVIVYGKDLFGKQYGFKASPTAYPDAVLTGLGFTKLASGAALPKDVQMIKRNKASDRFQTVKVLLENGKTVYRFIALATSAQIQGLNGVAMVASKIIGIGV